MERIDRYMEYYNEKRIQEKVDYQAPKEFGSVAA
ncbi:IS3 family transposase [Aureibacillus halotolerans]